MSLKKLIESIVVSTFIITTVPAFAETSANSNPGSLAKNTVTLAQDTAITTYIYAKIASKSDLANDNIDVSTNNGKVTLNGLVNNNDEAQSITQLAQATSGVKEVDASKLIIAHPTNSMYIKTTDASTPPNNANQINPEQPGGIQVQPQQDLDVSPKDPLAGAPQASNGQKDQNMQIADASSADEGQAALSDQPSADPVKHLSAPTKTKHHASKHCKGKKKKACKKHCKGSKHAKKVALKKAKLVKTAHHKAHKLQHSAHRKIHQQPAQAKRVTASAGSVDHMTKDYLKSAMMANETSTES